MIEGTVIAESLRVGADVELPGLTVRKISRFRVQDGAPDQPDIWTTLVFEADDADAGGLAEPIAGVLGPSGWYVDFRSAEETFVVFPDLVFRYRRGDQAARAQAQAHGRRLPSQSRSLTGPSEAAPGQLRRRSHSAPICHNCLICIGHEECYLLVITATIIPVYPHRDFLPKCRAGEKAFWHCYRPAVHARSGRAQVRCGPAAAWPVCRRGPRPAAGISPGRRTASRGLGRTKGLPCRDTGLGPAAVGVSGA